MAQMTLDARVTRGARLLDRRYPGWADRIDLSKLELRNCQACVLGQLFGSYRVGTEEIFWLRSSRRKNGFYAMTYGEESITHEYAELTRLWKVQILERQKEPFPTVARQVDSILQRKEVNA